MRSALAGMAAALLLGCGVSPSPVRAADKPTAGTVIEGLPIVLDGDTLLFRAAGPKGGDLKIRLWGVDAPEMRDWPWGPRAQAALADAIATLLVRCTLTGDITHERPVADCTAQRGTTEVDLASAVIAAGAAVPYRSFTHLRPAQEARLNTAEASARARRLGVWKD